MKNKKLTYTLEEATRVLERYCVYQDRCHQEIENKLRTMNMIPEAQEVIILHLMEHNFLNEERFAKNFARGKFRIKKWGKERIKRELKYKEISSYNLRSAMKEIDEQEYVNVLNELAYKKFDQIDESNPFKKRKKILDFLLRRGFESNLIYAKLDEMFSD